MAEGTTDRARAALAAERDLVKTLGGYVLAIAGAELVTHERIPIPRFNFVEAHGVSRGRQTAFFERALDHYFQRALRPTFRLPVPTPEHLVAGLERFGFRPRPALLQLLRDTPDRAPPADSEYEVRAARDAEVDEAVALWVGELGRAEFRAAVETARHHPNPGERLAPVVALRHGRIVSSALRYDHADTAGLHFVTTRPGERGQGAASALVTGAFSAVDGPPDRVRFLFADSDRLERRLLGLGFARAASFREYELPPEAELAFPHPGPPTPPRWRPPRTAGRT